MADFTTAHAFTARWEGGLSDIPQDRGGVTKYGVSLAFLREQATEQRHRDVLDRMGIILPVTEATIRRLTRDQGESIFRHFFWSALNLSPLPQRPATLLYDMAVNHGQKRAVILVQRGWNVVTTMDRLQLAEDGVLGPKTRAALMQDTDALISAVISAREDFFRAIVAKDEAQGVFLNGWLNRCADVRTTLGV